MALDPAGIYSDAAVLSALQGADGGRYLAFRYDLLSSTNGVKGALDMVTAGSISYDSGSDVKRTGQFTIVEGGTTAINYLLERIKPWIRLGMPDGGFVEWPQGVFLLSTPTRVLELDGTVTRQVTAYDQCVVMQADEVGDRYSVGAGTKYTDAITAAVAGYGFTINITPSTLTLPVAMDWAGGTSKLTIVNDLLSAINYQGAWFDANGTFQAIPYVLPDTQTPVYTYATDSTSVIGGAINDTVDLYSVPNRWVLVVSDPDRGVLRSEYTNTSSTSPTSTVSRGRTITSYVTDQTAPDQATLDALTRRTAFEASQVYEVIDFDTAVMPFHGNLTVLGVSVNGLGLGTVKFQETSWSYPLQVGAMMSHSVRRSVSVA